MSTPANGQPVVPVKADEKPLYGDMRDYKAPSMFQGHRTRQAIRDAHAGKIRPLMGYYAALSSPVMTRFLAPFGFDAVWIDWEHSSCNVETMTQMVHEAIFMSEGRTTAWVRIPGHDHAAVGFALDAGASVVVPQVETVEQAQHVLSASKFGTKSNGSRSAPPFRLIPGVTDGCHNPELTLHQNLNEQAAIMIQIESLQAIKNLDAILTACPDIDVVWLGSLDARVSMNLPHGGGMGGSEPEWLDALKIFEETMAKHDKPRGSFAFPPPMSSADQFVTKMDKLSFCGISADVGALMQMNMALKEARELIQPKPRTQ